MFNHPMLTLILDIFGFIGLIGGSIVVLKSKYLTESSKDAAILIDTQRKRIDALEETVVRQDKENFTLKENLKTMGEEIHRQAGELQAYRRLNYIEPEVITKLTTTLDSIMLILTKNGLIITQRKK